MAIKKTEIPEKLYDLWIDWIDNTDYICGEDGWVPSCQDLEELFDYYNDTKSEEKRGMILAFLFWVSETHRNLPKSRNRDIKDFLKEHMEIVYNNNKDDEEI